MATATAPAEQKLYIGGGETSGSEMSVVRARCMACRMMGALSCLLVRPMPGLEQAPGTSPIECYVKVSAITSFCTLLYIYS